MQAKAVRMVPNKDRYCIACGYEGSPNAGPSDDLRFYDNVLYHPICFEEVNYFIEMAQQYNAPSEVLVGVLEQLRINPAVLATK